MHLSPFRTGAVLTALACSPTPPPRSSPPQLFAAPTATKLINVDLGSGKSADVVSAWPVWPSSLSMARVIASAPSLVKGKRVLELGCGLGIIGLAAAQAGASEVLFTDKDSAVLRCAEEAAAAAGFTCTSTLELDWACGQQLPEELGPFDVIITADVLFHEGRPKKVSEYLDRLLVSPNAKALLADPAKQNYRGAFWAACETRGLDYQEAPMPGTAQMQLLGVTRKRR